MGISLYANSKYVSQEFDVNYPRLKSGLAMKVVGPCMAVDVSQFVD